MTSRSFTCALAAALDPPEVDDFATLGRNPRPGQPPFRDATEFSVVIGGSARGGKTKALLMDGLRARVRHPRPPRRPSRPGLA
jgi:hypothetical protein